jgi:hypothetical protein
MKRTLFIAFTIFSIQFSSGQSIIWQDVPFEKVTEISAKNDTLINNVFIPLLACADNGLAFMVTSSKLFYSGSDPESKRIKQEFERIANDYILMNKITDNYSTKERYAVTRRGTQFQLRKHQTIKRYLFGEGSGVNSYISIDEIPGYSEKEIFCIFNDNVDYSDANFNLDSIISPTLDRFITPNKKVTYKDDRNNYEFIYTAKLCTDGFEYKGFGTTLPTYFNLDLKITDKNTGKTQTLLQIPHDNLYRLSFMQIGDLNNDNKKDIIIQIETELCQERLIYLSTQDPNKGIFEFIGNMLIYCDYP